MVTTHNGLSLAVLFIEIIIYYFKHRKTLIIAGIVFFQTYHYQSLFVRVFAWVFIASLIVWYILKATMGIRVSEDEELMGMDARETGLQAYPEFNK